jgi:hypothetical protein
LENRNGNKWRLVAFERSKEIGHPEFGNIELLLTDHSLKYLRDNARAVKSCVDAVELHRAIDQRTHAVIVIATNVNFELIHRKLPP